jgi:hypothetical protein
VLFSSEEGCTNKKWLLVLLLTLFYVHKKERINGKSAVSPCLPPSPSAIRHCYIENKHGHRKLQYQKLMLWWTETNHKAVQGCGNASFFCPQSAAREPWSHVIIATVSAITCWRSSVTEFLPLVCNLNRRFFCSTHVMLKPIPISYPLLNGLICLYIFKDRSQSISSLKLSTVILPGILNCWPWSYSDPDKV